MSVDKEQVLSVLRGVVDPDLHKDIVSLGFVKEVAVRGGEVDFTIELTTPACPVKDEMKAQAESLVRALPGVTAARAKMTANVSTRGGMGRQQVPGIRNIIAVGAGKGGVGKSTTSVNLAVGLAQKGARVGLIDGDVYGPNIPQMLGLSDPPEVSPEKRILPPEALGIKVISMGMLVPPDQPIIWRGPMLHGAVQQFMRDVEWGELDYLVVDLPPGTGDVALSMAQSVPMAGAVVVTTPQGVSVSDVRKAVGMFRQLSIPVLGVIENMSYFVCGHCDGRTDIFGTRRRQAHGRRDADPVPRRGADRHACARGRRRGSADRRGGARRAGGEGLPRPGEPRRRTGLDPERQGAEGHTDGLTIPRACPSLALHTERSARDPLAPPRASLQTHGPLSGPWFVSSESVSEPSVRSLRIQSCRRASAPALSFVRGLLRRRRGSDELLRERPSRSRGRLPLRQRGAR